MEVVLLELVRKLGKIGDIVNVKDGYGKNFLLPKKKALRATKENLAIFESKKEDFHARNQLAKERAEKLVSYLDGKSVSIIRQSSADGKLFGSVTSKDIARLLTSDDAKITQDDVILRNPIKKIGISKVEISPYAEVSVEILVNIARSSDEAAGALRSYEAGLAVVTAVESSSDSLAEEV